MQVFELNMDGLVGSTHHYAGLALGNLASTTNAGQIANPQAAALQGLKKMQCLHALGLKQAVLPPHERPNLALLFKLGFRGSAVLQLEKAYRLAPTLLSAAYSASSMWAANAATVSASADTADKRLHFTAANLIGNLHRHQEAPFTRYLLKKIFADPHYFSHHPLLPKSVVMGDEGAANHNRLCAAHHAPGINIFVYGRRGLDKTLAGTTYPARQTLEACEAIARSHQLDAEKLIFARQNPKAIDAGVFHHDVIGLANETLLLLHEEAWLDQQRILKAIQAKADFPLKLIEISSRDLSLKEAVETYFFNAQLLSLPNSLQDMVLIAPLECEQNQRAKALIDRLIADHSNPISKVYYFDLKQSMLNGGGPACLRLRIPLKEREFQAMHQGVVMSDLLFTKLKAWVLKHYRSQLQLVDLRDPSLMHESLRALDELTQILGLGAVYPFQRY